MVEAIVSRTLLFVGCYTFSVALGSTASLAADAENGKTLAKRWCSSPNFLLSNR
jgi:hypothetical protein